MHFLAAFQNNAGDPVAATDRFYIDLDPGFTYISHTLTGAPTGSTCSYDSTNSRLECSFPGLAAGDAVTVDLLAQAPNATGLFPSEARVVCAGDLNTANDAETNQTSVVPGVDLVVTKAAGSGTFPAGSVITLDFTVTNNGPDPATTGIVLQDTLPGGLSFVGDDADPPADDDAAWDCSESGGVVTCFFSGTLGVGASSTFHFRVRADVPGPTVLVNEATAVVGDPTREAEINDADNTGSVNLTITEGTDVRIDKQVLTATPLVAGQPADFQLTVTNLGPMDTSDLTVTDVFPAGYTIDPADITAPTGWTCNVTDSGGSNPTVTCSSNGTPLASGDSVAITITATPPIVSAPESHTNAADVVVNDITDAVTSNNSDSVTYDVYPNQPDLGVVKTVDPVPVAQGYPLTITITVTNHGAVDANPVEIRDDLDPGETVDPATLPSGTPWDCTYDSANHDVVCTYTDNGGTLAAGASATVSYQVTAANAGTLTDTACATVNQSGYPDDYDGTNDCDSASTTSTVERADLVVSKTVNDTYLDTTEDTLTFTIEIINNGPDAATSVSFDDDVPFYVPAGTGGRPATTITVTSVTGGGTCNVTGGTVSCSWASIPSGNTVQVEYTVQRPMADGAAIVNDVCAYSSDVGDPDRTNNCDSAPAVQVDPVTDLEVVSKGATFIDDGSGNAIAGTEVTYTIEVRNNGPSDAANVQVTDDFSSSTGTFTFISTNATAGGTCSYSAPTVTCTWMTLPANTTATVTVVVRPDQNNSPPTPWQLVNDVTVTTATADSNPNNDGPFSFTLNLSNAQLNVVLEKNESPDFTEPVWYDPTPGSNQLVYELFIYNAGPSVATQIHIEDRVDWVLPLQSPAQQLEFLYDTENPDGTDDAVDWCTPPTPNPFPLNDVDDNAEPLIRCDAPAGFVLDPGASVTRYLVFRVLNSPDPITGDVYYNEATVTVYETPYETTILDNTEDERTTVRIITDVEVTKTGPGASVEIYTPFNMTITVRNYGPGYAPNTAVLDTLPSGMELTGTPSPSTGTCTGSAGDTSFTCDLGDPAPGDTVTITVPVMVTDPATLSYDNTACATHDAPDTNPDNDCSTATITMNAPLKLGDKVWYDQNQDGLQDAGEPGLDGVQVTLYNTPDCSGSPYQPVPGFANPVTTGSGSWTDGYYEFYPLPPGDYCLEFNVPTAVLDNPILSPQNAGTDDTVDSDAYEVSPGVYRIENIALTTNDDLTQDVGVYEVGSIGDRVWCESPTNVNDTFDPADGDAGLNNVTVNLYADFNCDGVADSATPIGNMTTFTNLGTAGYYQFTNLQVALAGSASQTCYVVEVDRSTLPAACSLPDTPDDAQRDKSDTPSLNLDTDNPDTDLADFSFRQADFGDLPENGSGTFPTTLGNNGPYHLLDRGLYLGSCVDAETDAAADDPDAGMVADGDDGTSGGMTIGSPACSDDEDGIEFVTPLLPGQQACIQVDAVNTTGGNAYLYGWADWNGDGQFDATERLSGGDFGSGAASIPNGGVSGQRYCFDVPASATFANGDIHFRFRLTTETLSADAFDGPASNGEVEDYWLPLLCVGNLLWNDGLPPVNSQQDAGESGIPGIPVRLVWAGPYGTVDTDPSDVTAQNDDAIVATTITDANGRYAFCGIAPPSQAGKSYTFQVQVPSHAGLESVTKDAVANDQIDSDGAPSNTLGSGWVADTFTVAPNFSPLADPAYLTIDGNPPPTKESGLEDGNSQSLGTYPDERTDWTQDFGFVVYKDYGDLPDTFGTLLTSGGPWHWVTPDLYLGSCVDAETDGTPDAPDAGVLNGGDDGATGFRTFGSCATPGDDEDGVELLTPLIPGQEACVQVSAVNTTGRTAYLYAWFDWNGDGTFDTGEKVNTGDFGGGSYAFTGNLSNQQLCFTVPSTAIFDGGEVHYRFRLTTDDALADPTGAAPDGEVEDYWLRLACVGNYVWNDSTGTLQDQQDAGDIGVSGVDVTLRWDGNSDSDFADPEDRTYTVTTDANGRYDFCGLVPGRYQVEVTTPPAGLPEAVYPNQAADDLDSDGVQTASGGPSVAPVFTITDVTDLPTGETGNQDLGAAGGPNSFPDNQVNETIDFGFRPTMLDYGDAPDSYGTSSGTGGPTHVITPDLYLGSCVDAELDAATPLDTTGDDANAGYYTTGTCTTPGDDEDGVRLVTPLVPGSQACVQVTARNATGGDAYLYAWFDWNGNDAFDAGELVNTGDFAAGSVTIPNGGVSGQQYCFDVPTTAIFQGGAAVMRFRLTTDSALAGPTGAAPDGEVEDYREPLYCAGNFVWNDGGSATFAVQDGTEPGIAGVEVTLRWDGNDNGAFTDGADRTYTTTTDANGFYTFCGLVPDATRDGNADAYRIDVTPPAGLTIVPADQGGNEALDSDADPVTGQGPVFTLPPSPDSDTAGNDTDPNRYPDSQTHLAVDFGLVAYDFGDLPSPYKTTLADGGPRHTILPTDNPALGTVVDPETNGQPNATATGDDNTGTDDEDGVTLPATFVAGHTYTITCTVSNATSGTANLSAWIDWNGDGDFADPGEQVLNNADATTACPFTVTVPLDVAPQVGVRFRIANESIPGPDGALGSGEVEDYLVAGQLTYDFGDAPDTFDTLNPSDGPKHQLNAGLYLGACVDGETDAAPDPDAGVLNDGDDATTATVTVGTCASPGDDEDGVQLITPLLPGAEACVQVTAYNATGGNAYLYAWFDWNGDGSFEAGEQVNTGDFSAGYVTIPNGGVSGQQYCFTVPSTATFDGGEVHMRFRLTTAALTASDWGGVAPDGEVEDYWTPLACVGNYVWDDTASTSINAQDASDLPLKNITMELTTPGRDGALGTADDVTVTTTTDAQGRYTFCGLTPGTQGQLRITTLPAGLNQVVTPDFVTDDQDSDATQPGGLGSPAEIPVFTVPGLADLAANNWTTGEAGNEDASTQTDPALVPGYPDGRTDLSFDFGFRKVNGQATKSLVATDQTFTTGTDVAIGEIVTYETTLTLSPGTVANLTLTDVLDQGLAFVTCDSITVTGNLTVGASAWDAICRNPRASEYPAGSTDPVDQGRQVTWTFGTVTNSGTDDATITVRYRAVVLDSADNTRGQTLANQATWTWDAGSESASADPVTVVEPTLTVEKVFDPTVAAPDEVVNVYITVTHDASSDADAFDVVLTDALPEGLNFVSGSLALQSGLAPDTLTYDPGTRTIRATWSSFPQGSTAVITFKVDLNVPDGVRVTNEAWVGWTSLPCDACDTDYALSTYNALARERSYDPPDAGYISRTSAEVYWVLPDTGFAPGRVTVLPPKPADFDYQATNMWLEIPKLGIKIPVVGVPRTRNGWDLTWLGENAGWMEGTAFPTWQGNSVLTAHVTLPSGGPGPFAQLDTLMWGDQVLIYYQGQVYVYEVRERVLVAPTDTSAVAPTDYPTLTLITCADWSEVQGRYLSRWVVKAVLIEVQNP